MSTKPNSPPKPFESMELLSLPKIEPPSPPVFPTFQQLVEEDLVSLSSSLVPTRKLNDLFDGMLGTLDPLLADYQANPEKYGVETHALLEQLMHGSKSLEQLSTTERRLLNLATLDFYAVVQPKVEPPRPVAREMAEEDAEPDAGAEHDEEEKSASADTKKPEAPIPGVDVPVTELPAYWWLQ